MNKVENKIIQSSQMTSFPLIREYYVCELEFFDVAKYFINNYKEV